MADNSGVETRTGTSPALHYHGGLIDTASITIPEALSDPPFKVSLPTSAVWVNSL